MACRDEVALLPSGVRQIYCDFVVRNAFIPPAQCPADGFFDNSLLVVLASKAPDGIHTREECD